MHIAASTDVPLVAIYGPGSPDLTAPLRERVSVVYEPMDCSPCRQVGCTRKVENTAACLHTLSVDKVFAACKRLLEI